MSHMMKGYGGVSLMELTNYSKQLATGRVVSSHAVLELDVYKKEKHTGKKYGK